MKRALFALVTLGVAASGVGAACQNPVQNPVPPSTIYDELTDAGCYRANDAGLSWVTKEVTQSSPPAWAVCLREGGTVPGCGVPCSAPKP